MSPNETNGQPSDNTGFATSNPRSSSPGAASTNSGASTGIPWFHRPAPSGTDYQAQMEFYVNNEDKELEAFLGAE
ncbi:uncharacterized protein IL334_005314 [Kwoniella shivajii]|uniref:Uncharacterized protein n=1 Tax=Kwoniella shivajii TaxID=564305 RepID=A0ABZ1D3E4_9TREE|nr:hypothetical protein IL334_005314 [Kwoniella shivajii]